MAAMRVLGQLYMTEALLWYCLGVTWAHAFLVRVICPPRLDGQPISILSQMDQIISESAACAADPRGPIAVTGITHAANASHIAYPGSGEGRALAVLMTATRSTVRSSVMCTMMITLLSVAAARPRSVMLAKS